MSTFKVNYTKIIDIIPHPKPEVHSLDIAIVYGFQVVIRRGSYSVGDSVFYCPIDSVLPKDLEDIIFPPSSKIKLNNSRVRQTRIQGFPSQGLLLNVNDVLSLLKNRGLKTSLIFELDKCYSSLLEISKYEPPIAKYQQVQGKKTGRKAANNFLFHSYNGIQNIKYYPNAFTSDDEVVVEEKLHGSNVRCYNLPTQANTLWKKILKFFRLLPKYEKGYGSNNVDLTNRVRKNSYYGEDVYGKVLNKVGAFDKIKPNEIIYGELIGEGIQKNYHYGHKEHHFVLFDVKVYNEETKEFSWLLPEEVEAYAKERGFDFVPVLYRGKFNKQLIEELVSGPSVYYPPHKIREGIVVKSRDALNDKSYPSAKKMFKWINPDYLDKNNSDFH